MFAARTTSPHHPLKSNVPYLVMVHPSPTPVKHVHSTRALGLNSDRSNSRTSMCTAEGKHASTVALPIKKHQAVADDSDPRLQNSDGITINDFVFQ